MRLTFITSCLEPGKDGVGDYTLELAKECVHLGHQCSLIALNDQRAPKLRQAEITAGTKLIPELRLPSTMPWPDRVARAHTFQSQFQPDWVSLQLVPYGFADKGILHGLAGKLHPIVGGAPLHLMAHELWIGGQTDAPLKDRLMGAVQKAFALRLIHALQPRVIHTSNPTYVQRLAQEGLSSGVLPLFGNIPFSAHHDFGWLVEELKHAGVDASPAERKGLWVFGLFGSLPPVWPPEPLFSYLTAAAAAHGRKIVIASIGRIGAGEELWDSLSKKYSGPFAFCKLGERTPERISQFFQWIDFGLAATPWSVLGKSGTVAAMMEHGLPVIVNREEEYRGIPLASPTPSPLLCRALPNLPSRLAYLQRQPPHATRSDVTLQFLRELQPSHPHHA